MELTEKMDEKVIVIFKTPTLKKGVDIEIPLNITANELIYGLNNAFKLGIDMHNPGECYLRLENPTALLRGDTLLEEFGIRNGATLYKD